MSTKKGAYFSYDGGATNGADGVDGSKKVYNTDANGEDYADFFTEDNCSKAETVQDATGCPGQDAALNILNDGRGEINILNAVGFNLVSGPIQSLTASKPLINFGTIDFSSSASKKDSVELQNEASTSVTISSILIDPTYGDASQFTFDSSKCSDGIKPGKKCKIDVSFNADAAIISRATLQIPHPRAAKSLFP